MGFGSTVFFKFPKEEWKFVTVTDLLDEMGETKESISLTIESDLLKSFNIIKENYKKLT